MGFKDGDFPNAEAYYERGISLPMYSGLTERDQDYVIDRLREFLR
jgi:dTDP-4-amino-4,6-dideoxygalactose transaminase